MALRAALKVPKYGLFYFKSDRTISVVPLKNVVEVINGDHRSKGSKVLLKFNTLTLEAEIIGVDGTYYCLPTENSFLVVFKLLDRRIE